MRTDQWGKIFVIRKRGASSDSAKGCVGVLRSSGMTPCMEKAKPSEETLTGVLVPRTRRSEPARLSTHAPETCASTNSATWASWNYGVQK